MYRTHTCGCLRACNVHETVTLAGWVQKVRNLGAMTFIDLRDRYGLTQIVVEEHSPGRSPRNRCPPRPRNGSSRSRARSSNASRRTPRCPTGDIEVSARRITVLHEAEVPPFTIEEVSDGGDDLRMKYRYLDLRRPPLQRNLILRHKMAQRSGRFLSDEGFLEIETPYLVNSTPRGRARLRGPEPHVPEPVLRPAAVAPDPEAAADGRRIRQVFPDRALLPRRGPARRPPAGIHPDRLRDVVRRAGGRTRNLRALAKHMFKTVLGIEFPEPPAPDAGGSRPWRSTARTNPTCVSAWSFPT